MIKYKQGFNNNLLMPNIQEENQVLDDDLKQQEQINSSEGEVGELTEIKNKVDDVLLDPNDTFEIDGKLYNPKVFHEIEEYIEESNYDGLIGRLKDFDEKYHSFIFDDVITGNNEGLFIGFKEKLTSSILRQFKNLSLENAINMCFYGGGRMVLSNIGLFNLNKNDYNYLFERLMDGYKEFDYYDEGIDCESYNYYDILSEYKNIFNGIEPICSYLEHFWGINYKTYKQFNLIYKNSNQQEISNFISKIKNSKDNIIKGKGAFSSIEGINIENLGELVHPKRNNSPENIENYEDKSEHLDNYKFNKNGYNFTLSNLLGYELVEGEKIDESILEEFKKYIEHISVISRDKVSLFKSVEEYSKNEGIELESEKLESKILEYLLKKEKNGKEIDVKDFDLLIAYQLMGKYDEFMKSSNDKLATYGDEQTKYMIQIQALLNEYGDPLKESIKKLENITLESKDKKYFEGYLREIPKEVSDLIKDKTINSIIRSFENRPKETITDEIVKKSINTKLKGVLQASDITEQEKSSFINEFKGKDFQFKTDDEKQNVFEKKWKEKVEEYFGLADKVGLNIRQIAKTQDFIYNTLQTESNKFESITDKNGKDKDRRVFARFGKTKYDSYARGVGDICIASDEGMWKNPDYFELVLFDKERQKNIGTTMLLNMEEDNGKKYLLFGPNPSVEFDDKISSGKLFEKISDIVIDFAKVNNYDGILFDSTHGRSTNRSGDFQKALEKSQLKNDNSEIDKIDLNKEYKLGGGYKYQNGLSYLWKK